MGAIARLLPTTMAATVLLVTGCGYLDDGSEVRVTPLSKTVTVSGTVRDGTAGPAPAKLDSSFSAKPKAVPAGGCPSESFTIRVGTEETCSVPLGGGIHEYEITASVNGGTNTVVVNFRRDGFPPSSQSIALSGTGETIAPTFAPRVYDKRETVDETATFTVEADNASDDDFDADAIIEIQAETTGDDVTVSVLVVDPSDAGDRNLLPGEQVNEDEQELEQFAAVEITLSDSDGEEVQPADGKPITVTLNLPPAAVAGMRELIAGGGAREGLQVGWRSYNEDTEVWQEEDADPSTPGVQGAEVIFDGEGDDAEPVSVRAFISHLTWYAAGDAIRPSEQGCLAVAVEDSEGNPVDDAVIKLEGEGEAFGDKAITDSSGVAYLDSLISTDDNTRTVSLAVIRDGSTVARLTAQSAPTTGGVSAAQKNSCDLGPVMTINVEGSVTGTVVRGFQRNSAANAAVFIESTDDGIDGLARTRSNSAGTFTFTVPTPFNFEVFAGSDSRTGMLAAGAASTDAGEIFLGNAAPDSASIESSASITVPTGSISLTGAANDVDGDSLNYTWSAAEGSFSNAAGETVSWQAPDSPSGSTLITVTASDGELTTTASLTLSWDEVNVAPTIDSLSSTHTGNVPNGSTATVTAIASDANSEDTISYSWSTNVGSIETGTDAVQFTAPADGFGSATITLEISDGEFSVIDTFIQGFGTPPNQPPTINSVGRSPEGSVTRGATVDVTVSATDPDSAPSPLTISWTASAGSFNGPTNGATAQWLAPSAVGSFNIVVAVSDGEATETDTLTVVVTNSAPVISSATSSPAGTVGKASVVALTAVASDPDGDDITYQWSADVGSFNGSQQQATAEWLAPDSGGTALITVTVSDGLLQNSETVSLTISSNGPVINSLSAAPSGDVQRGTSIALTSDASDPDGDDISYEWTSNIGSFSGSVTDPAASWVAPDASGDAIIALTVTDGEFTTTDTLSFAVLNHEPVINSVTSDPSGTVAKSTTVALSSEVSDNDGDATLEWSASNGSFNGATNQATAEWLAPVTPGVSTLTLTVTDGEFTSSKDIAITVENAAPVIESILRTPAGNIGKGDAVSFEAEVFDANGDDVTYSWTSDAGSFSTAIDGPNATWDAPLAPGTYQVTLMVSDGTDSDTNIVEITVVNSAPVANDDIATTNVNEATAISVLANDNDADEDTLSVTAITSSPANGVAVIDGNQVRYTPNAEFIGTDSFSYQVSDGFATDTAVTTVTVTELQSAEFGDFNAISWYGGLESDSRFDSKRLAYYSGLFGISLLDQGAGEVNASIAPGENEYQIELNTSSGFTHLVYEEDDDDFSDQLAAKADSGAIYINVPFSAYSEEGRAEIHRAQTIRLLPAGENNYVGSEIFTRLSGQRPVVSDAGRSLNTDVSVDDYFEPGVQFFMRKSESFDVSVLSGDYGFVTQRITIEDNADRGVQGHVGVVSMSSGVGSVDSLIVSSLYRSSGNFSNDDTFGFQEVLDPGETIDYNLAPPSGDLTGRVQGTLQVQLPGGGAEPAEALDGFVDPDGKVFTLTSPLFSETVPGQFSEVQLSLTRGVRLGSGVVDADLIGNTYHMTLHNTGLDEGSNHSIEVSSSFRARFDAGGVLTYLCGSETLSYETDRNSDTSAPSQDVGNDAASGGGVCKVSESGNDVIGTWSLDSDRGELSLTMAEDAPAAFAFDLRGFVSEGLDHLILSEYELAPAGENFYSSGIVIGALVSEDRFDNLPPEITLNAGVLEPILLSHGESIELHATTSDADGDPVTVEWFAGGAGTFSHEVGSISTFTAPLHGHGSTRIFATARDGKSPVIVPMDVEFGPAYAFGASQEQHAAAAEDIDDSLLEPDDVTGFLVGFNPWTEAGNCLPFDSNGDTVETTGTQTRTHVDSGGTDASSNELQVGDVIELIYDDCLEDDEFEDAYSNGTITLTITEVPFASGDGVHTFAWIAEWDYEGRYIEDLGEEIEFISGRYTVTQQIEVEGGDDESRITRVEMLAGLTPKQELRIAYTAAAGDSYNYGFTEGVVYIREGTVIELAEDDYDWELSFTLNQAEFSADESTQRTGLVATTVASLAGRIEGGGLTESVDYVEPESGVLRNEYSIHPAENFSGTRVVALDVQFNDPSDFPDGESDMLIYVIEDWDGISTDFEIVAETDFDIIDDYETAPEGERYTLLPPSFDGQQYRLVELGRRLILSPFAVYLSAESELVRFGLADGPDPDTVELHLGEGVDRDLELQSTGSFSTIEYEEREVENERYVFSVENGHILASFGSEFGFNEICSETNETLATADGGAVYVSAYRDNCERFAEVFTDGDDEPDGFNASDRQFNEAQYNLNLFLREDADSTTADLAGDYGLVTFLTAVGTGGSSYQNQVTMLKSISLEATGDYVETTPVDAGIFLIERDEDGGEFFVAVEEYEFAGVTDLDLEVLSGGGVSGSFELENGDSGDLEGAASIASGIISVSGFFDGEGSDRGLIDHILVKRSASPVLNNTEWLVQGISAAYEFDNIDNAWIANGIGADDVARMVIDGTGTVTWSGTDYAAAIDVSEPDGETFIRRSDEDQYSVTGTVATSPSAGDVALLFAEADSTVTFEGYQSIDGNLMVMRVKGQDDGSAAEGQVSTGIYVLVRNDLGNTPNQAPSIGEISDPGVVTPGTTASLTVSGVVDPEGETISYTWYASLGSFTTDTDSSVEQDRVQVISNAGTTVTWHAPPSANAGESALIRVQATDGERFRATDIQIDMD